MSEAEALEAAADALEAERWPVYLLDGQMDAVEWLRERARASRG
jgi:hypothetical protein